MIQSGITAHRSVALSPVFGRTSLGTATTHIKSPPFSPDIKCTSAKKHESSGGGLNRVSKSSQSLNEPLYCLACVTLAEVIGAEVGIFDTIVQHVPGRREDGRRNGEDSFFGTPPGIDAQETRVHVAMSDADGHPGSCHQGSFLATARLCARACCAACRHFRHCADTSRPMTPDDRHQ